MTLPTDFTNETVAEDVHPDAHNATNAAVNDLDTRVTNIEDAGAVILDGAGAPDNDGTVGDYYLDTTNHVLYGPKNDVFGADQTIAVAGAPLTDYANQEYGLRILFDVAGIVERIRYYRLATSFDLMVRAWRAAGTKITEVAAVTGAAGWVEATFPAPVVIAAGETVTFSVGSLTATDEVPVKEASVTGQVTDTTDCNFVDMRFSSTVRDTFPNTTITSQIHYIEPIFESGVVWPVAVYGIPPGGTTGQALKKVSATDYHVAWTT